MTIEEETCLSDEPIKSGEDAGDAENEAAQGAEVQAQPVTEVPDAEIQEEPASTKPASTKAASTKAVAVKPAPAEPDEPEEKMDWYILKVQSNRENSIVEALKRRVSVAGLDEYFGDVVVPVEMVTEFKGGKKKVVKKKLYPGYIVAQMIINDDTWFLVRETPGIGDFTGSGGKPTPMQPHEVQRIVVKEEEKGEKAPILKIPYNVEDRVKINEGTFENFEGEVSTIDQASGRVTVMINIFGRSTPVELEYWQIEVL